MPTDSTGRFSNRVENYVKYRPGYSAEIVSWLRQTRDLRPGKVIADIGSGTGISSSLFLEAGYQVFGVEPNSEMREKSIELLAAYPDFQAVPGEAENTHLEPNSIDAVVAGQAFHWFDTTKAKLEFKRILRPGGLVVLLWNERLTASAFEKEYNQLIVKHGKDYVEVDHRNIGTEDIAAFFHPQPVQLKIFPNKQVFDFNGLKGRLLSSSYMPLEVEPGAEAMINDLALLYKRFEENGRIEIHYETKVYVGQP
jgi:SAM-dependent methyltransferase